MGFGVLGMTAYQMIAVEQPVAEMMGFVGFLAFLAKLASVLLLLKFRDGDANVRSVWLCSRNDAIGNVAVICTSGAVWLTASDWPDLVVAARVIIPWPAGQRYENSINSAALAIGRHLLLPNVWP